MIIIVVMSATRLEKRHLADSLHSVDKICYRLSVCCSFFKKISLCFFD